MDWIEELTAEIRATWPAAELRRAEPLAGYTSFHIGGPAALIGLPRSTAELAGMRRLAAVRNIPTVLLGAGTNVLAPDEGMDAFVICTREGMGDVLAMADNRLLARCGASLAKVAMMAQSLGLAGLEFAHGIPGTVGGGIMMNAGAYGGELADVAARTRALTPEGEIRTFSGAEQKFGYRDSVFQGTELVILETEFILMPDDPAAIRARMQALREKRAASQPLEYPSAGSTFKRPKDGFAAALIDQAGLKGLAVGGAQVSEKHAGFVINRGGATAADVLTLMHQVQERVFAHSGIRLEPEVRILGTKGENLTCNF